MTEPVPADVTEVLARWSDGEANAMADLLPLVYEELRRIARGYLRQERQGHTLQPTALVHEAYVRLADRVPAPFADRVHFFAAVAKVMRQILVDHARRHGAGKRGGGAVQVPIEAGVAVADPQGADLLHLDDALQRLGAFDPRKARIVELRFFGGLTIDECARVMSLSSQTIINDTRKARAWLVKEIRGGRGGP